MHDRTLRAGDRFTLSEAMNLHGSLVYGLCGADGKVFYVGKTRSPAPVSSACMVDCLHIDDVAELLAEKGLSQRPAGK